MTPQAFDPPLRRRAYLLVLPFLAIAMVRLSDGPVMGGDALSYLIPIHNWMAGAGYTMGGEPHLIAPPGLGIFSYLFFLMGWDIPWSGVLASLSSYLLMVAAFVAMQRHLTPMGALAAVVLVGLHPNVFGYATVGISETLTFLILVLQYWGTLACWSSGARWERFFALGLATGFGYLVRPELLATGTAALGMVSVRALFTERHMAFSRRLLGPVLAIVVVGAMMFPYVSFLSRVEGQLTLTGKGMSTLRLIDSRKGLVTPASTTKGKLTLKEYYLNIDSKLLMDRLSLGFWRERHFLFTFTRPALLLLVAGVLAYLWRLRVGPRHAVREESLSRLGHDLLPLFASALPMLLPLAILPFIHVFDRHLTSYGIILVLLFCGAAGWSVRPLLLAWSAARRTRFMVALPVVAALLTVAHFPLQWFDTLQPIREHRQSQKSAGEWLTQNRHRISLEHTTTPPKLAALLFYYATDRSTDFPLGIRLDWRLPLPELLDSMRAGGVRHVVLTRESRFYHPQLQPLWDPAGEVASLGFTHVHTEPGVFRVLTLNPLP